jgi:hypothetical protein
LREALARSDLDFVAYESPGRDKPGKDTSRLPRVLRMAGISTAALVGGVILVNALFLQDSKHPAPLMRVPDPPAPQAAPVALAPLPVVPIDRKGDAIGDTINRLSATPDRKLADKPADKPAEKPADKARDPIAALLAPAAPAPEKAAAPAPAAPSAAVLAAQKALLRLGYVVRADGFAGATTRQVIERYERDNHLPVHGDLTPKLMRELAAKSGIPAR